MITMKTNEELEKRLEKLEIEQERQDTVLDDFLREFEEVLKLEAKLANIDNYEFKLVVPKKEVSIQDSDDALMREGGNKGGGYVIRLVFNPKKPSEWAEEGGGGWRDYGMGMRYPDLQRAKQRLQELRTQWPDYPMKIVQVKAT
ncbi:MAG: hypothetical protein BWK79_10180 [Beggiatoa sp. IS2]|nr:MAG: hypothetical protein BWK79_10180 [Beggiatoa sp. IS2]